MLSKEKLQTYGIHDNDGNDRIGNLQKLSKYLRDYDKIFSMKSFFNAYQNDYYLAQEHDCQSAACAIGHGPNVGIDPKSGETWGNYSFRVFVELGDALRSNVWDYCFSSEWSKIDDTAKGAAD